MAITKSEAKQLQRRNPAGLVRLVEVQEQQIAALQREIDMLRTHLTAVESALTGVAQYRLGYDTVDAQTGEVTARWA